MQDLLPGAALLGEARQHVLEIARVGLVRADVLGGVDRVERDLELLLAVREGGAVDVGQDHQPVVLLEIGERRGGVGKSRPVLDRGAERARRLRIGCEAEPGRKRAMHPRQQVRIEQAGGCRLLRRFRLGERGQDLLAAVGCARPLEPGPERLRDAGLPVDQRAVAVEGQDRIVGQSHGSPPRAPSS